MFESQYCSVRLDFRVKKWCDNGGYDAEGGVRMKMDGLYLGLEFLLFELSRFTLFWSHLFSFEFHFTFLFLLFTCHYSLSEKQTQQVLQKNLRRYVCINDQIH